MSRWLKFAFIASALGTLLGAGLYSRRAARRYVAVRGAKVSLRDRGLAPRSKRSLPYLSGLDGLRAVAVMAVLLYHAESSWVPGGFLGVEVFFVISGFLITSLLLGEQEAAGRVNIRGFWKRRALRLLPALYALLIGILAYSAIFLRGEVASLREAALAALAYVSNWYLVFDKQSYFETFERASPLRHLWSLAVEEQFYLVWPLLFSLVFSRLKPAVAAPLVLAGAVASTVLMAVLYNPAADPSRVYYGTDTRAGGLLLGAAFAFVWSPGRAPQRLLDATSRTIDLYAFAGFATLAFLFLWLHESSAFLYRGGFALCGVATVAIIAAAVHPEGRAVAALLGRQPLRYIGQRSYSIYLWHWPLFVLTRPGVDIQLHGLPLLALRFAITFALAEASYRLVETPMRRGALGRWWNGLRGRFSAPDWHTALRPAMSLAAVGVAVAMLGFSVVSAHRPEPPSYLAVSEYHSTVWSDVTEAQEVAVQLKDAPDPTTALPAALTPPPATPVDTAAPAPVTATTAPEPTPGSPASSAASETVPIVPDKPPPPLPGPPSRVFAIGDSVMLGAVSQMQALIPNLEIDSVVGRQVSEGIDILRWRRDSGLLGDVVVVHLGNNGTFTAGQFDEMMEVLAGVPRVVFVSVKVPRGWEGGNNSALGEGVSRYPNATLVDWHGSSSTRPELFWDDGIHLRPEGAAEFASLVALPVNAP